MSFSEQLNNLTVLIFRLKYLYEELRINNSNIVRAQYSDDK